MPQYQATDGSANMLPQLDIPQLRYIEPPSRHPETNSHCGFDDSTTPVYPRNSYDVPTPSDYKSGESWWPDGLNELDPRPRNLSKACRKALKAGPRTRFHQWFLLLPGDHRPIGEKDVCRECISQSKWTAIRREKAKERVEKAVNKAVEEDREKVRKGMVEKEARKEFEERYLRKQTAHSILKLGLVFTNLPKRLKELILAEFEVTEQEIAEGKLLRPWTEPEPAPTAPQNLPTAPIPNRRATVCYSPPDPEEVRKEALKKKNEHDAAIKLYVMWEDSPLGVPDAEGSEGKMWEEYIKQERRRGLKAGERR